MIIWMNLKNIIHKEARCKRVHKSHFHKACKQAKLGCSYLEIHTTVFKNQGFFFRGKEVIFMNFKIAGGGEWGKKGLCMRMGKQDLPGAGNVCFSFLHWCLL